MSELRTESGELRLRLEEESYSVSHGAEFRHQ